MAKKVLIAHATGGMGHVMAARAVEEVFKNKYPEIEVKNVDVIDYATKLYKKVFVEGYNYVSAKKPELWGWLYRSYNKKSSQKIPTLISKLAIEGKFIPFVKEFNPDFIVSTHPLPMVLISHSKREEVIDISSSMVITDFGCHTFWIDEEVNYYFVATEEVKKSLAGYNVDLNKIVVSGIPIGSKFSQPLNKEGLIKKFNLNPDLFTLFIVGGQFSFTDLTKIITGIQKINRNKVQFIVVAGRDKDLKEALDGSDLNQDSNIKVFGFVDNMEELMTVSDLIFSKAGGLTVSECLAKGLPLIINKVIPGQEEDNVNFLVRKGVAVKAASFDQIIKKVNNLLIQPEKITKMKQACQQLGKPKSAETLADFVYNKINEK